MCVKRDSEFPFFLKGEKQKGQVHNQFVSLVVERESLTGNVPGFDVLPWIMLTDQKYSALLYQKYNDQFQIGFF